MPLWSGRGNAPQETSNPFIAEGKRMQHLIYIKTGLSIIMHLSMLSSVGEGACMWGIDFSDEFLVKTPHCGGPKLGQIRSNIPRCSINLY